MIPLNNPLVLFVAGMGVCAIVALIFIWIGFYMGSRSRIQPTPSQTKTPRAAKAGKNDTGKGPFSDHIKPIGSDRRISTIKEG